MNLINRIETDLSDLLSLGRFRHTQGVAETARSLAYRYGADPEKAYLGGWLHDIAKEYKPADLLGQAEFFGLEIHPVDRENPALLHARIGAKIAEQRYAIRDPEILQAITCHTLGSENMSLLAEIVFVADAIEPGRSEVWAGPIRKTLEECGLRAAIVHICKGVIRDLLHPESAPSGQSIHPSTIATYNAYLKHSG